MEKKPKISKDDRIKKELRKLKSLYKELPKNKQKLCEKLIGNAAFMAVTLEDLQEQVNKEGAVVKQKNGNGFNVKNEHPAQKSYNVMIGKYTAVIAKLDEMLPEEIGDNKLGKFLNG
jgi:hypothetical protein